MQQIPFNDMASIHNPSVRMGETDFLHRKKLMSPIKKRVKQTPQLVESSGLRASNYLHFVVIIPSTKAKSVKKWSAAALWDVEDKFIPLAKRLKKMRIFELEKRRGRGRFSFSCLKHPSEEVIPMFFFLRKRKL